MYKKKDNSRKIFYREITLQKSIIKGKKNYKRIEYV